MNGIWTPILGAVGIIVAALLTYFATRGKDKTGGVNAYIDQLQEDRKADREEFRLQKEEWAKERKKLKDEFAAEMAAMKAAFLVERNELRAELDAALAEVRRLSTAATVQTTKPPKEAP